MMEPQALPDRKAQQVQTEHKVLRELQDRLVLRVPKVPLVCKAWQEMMVLQVPPDHRAQQVQTVHKVLRESQDQLVPKDCKVFRA
jgi:hypothetical protein